MQKNVPKYTPDWVRTVPFWAETSKREVSYALCNDRRTLLWFANQRAVEYHPALVLRRRPRAHDPPRARPRPARGRRVPDGGAGGPARAPGARRPRAGRGGEDQRGEGRARVRADRAVDLDGGRGGRDPSHRGAGRGARPRGRHHGVREGRPGRQGVRRLDPRRRRHRDRGLQPAGAARRAGVVPRGLGRPRRHHARDFTVHTALDRLGDRDPWAEQMPEPQALAASWSRRARRSRSPGWRRCTRASAAPARKRDPS